MRSIFPITALTALLVTGAAFAGTGAAGAQDGARPAVLEDGGPSHHHALHRLNPLVARYKALYPSRVHLMVEDTGEEYTILNDGPHFDVAAGLYGKAYLQFEISSEAITEIYELVKDGMPGEGMPRLELAMRMREAASLPFEKPDEPSEPGPGPGLNRLEKDLARLVELTGHYLEFTGKASQAQADGKKLAKLYWGLRGKVAVHFQGKKTEKVLGTILRELGRDLEEGRLELTPGGVWSTWVNVYSFYMTTRHPPASGLSRLIEPVKERLQGILHYQQTLPPTPELEAREEILQDRLALVEKMVDLGDL